MSIPLQAIVTQLYIFYSLSLQPSPLPYRAVFFSSRLWFFSPWRRERRKSRNTVRLPQVEKRLLHVTVLSCKKPESRVIRCGSGLHPHWDHFRKGEQRRGGPLLRFCLSKQQNNSASCGFSYVYSKLLYCNTWQDAFSGLPVNTVSSRNKAVSLSAVCEWVYGSGHVFFLGFFLVVTRYSHKDWNIWRGSQ